MNRHFRLAAAVALLAFPAGTQTAPVTVARVSTIGCVGCGDARELPEVYDLQVNARGEVLVVASDAPTLRLFSRDGALLQQQGRPGSGPGEYSFPMRAAWGAEGSIHILDMRLRRITHLLQDGSVEKTVPFSSFPAATAIRGESGELVMLGDDFRGTFTLERWSPDGSPAVLIARIDHPPRADGTVTFPSIAVSATGVVAVARDGEDYHIARLTPDGKPLPEIARDVPRVRRSPDEQAQLNRRIQNVRARVTAERGVSKAPAPLIGANPNDLSLKPHFPIDGLRFDPQGRLWVLTSRGSANESVFDLFAPAGSFLGALRVPSLVKGFSLGGSYLVTSGERDDGTPIVELWMVKGI
jgi:hypothetical protein